MDVSKLTIFDQARLVKAIGLKNKLILRQQALDSFYIFCRDVMQAGMPENLIETYEGSSDTHEEVCEFLQNWDKPRKLLQLPRDFLKTTIGTIYYTVWLIIKDPNIRIHIDSEVKKNSRRMVGAIRSIFEKNTLMRELYGDFVNDRNWTDERFIVSQCTRLASGIKEDTVSCGGLEASEVGQHIDLWIIDDIYSQNNISTPEQIEKPVAFYRQGQPIIGENKVLVIGTTWHFNDFLEQIKDEKQDFYQDFDIYCKGYLEDGINICPAKYTDSYIGLMKRSMSEYEFSCQYMNKPITLNTQQFKPEYFKFFEDDEEGKWRAAVDYDKLIINITVDPAFSEEDKTKKRDRSAIVITGTDSSGNIYVLDIVNAKLKPGELVAELFHLSQKWNPLQIGIEEAAAQNTLQSYLDFYAQVHGECLSIVMVKHKNRAKAYRILALEPFARQGKIHLEKNKCMALYSQMITWVPFVSTVDDLCDSFQYQLQLLNLPSDNVKESEFKDMEPAQRYAAERNKRVRKQQNRSYDNEYNYNWMS